MEWPVVPLCEAQLKDVRPEDVLEDGLYRKCDTYRGGGGYDKFNAIYEKRMGRTINPTQFVVQLKGCPLKCPYCYVTTAGINSEPVMVHSMELYHQYRKSGLEVFHLMGGAPALYLESWQDLGVQVELSGGVFHSDFLLVEKLYQKQHLSDLVGLHAVSIKDYSFYSGEQLYMLRCNLTLLMKEKVNFYITFTGNTERIERLLRDNYPERIFEDSFHIDIIDYEALQ